jgi:hypothetical protein
MSGPVGFFDRPGPIVHGLQALDTNVLWIDADGVRRPRTNNTGSKFLWIDADGVRRTRTNTGSKFNSKDLTKKIQPSP